MRKRNFLVLDENADRGLQLRDFLKQNYYDADHMTGLHDPKRATDYDGFILASRYLEAFGSPQIGEDACKSMVKAGITIPGVYVAEGKVDRKDVKDREYNKKEKREAKDPNEARLFDGVVDRKSPEFESELLTFLGENTFIPLRIGFVSGGRLTTGIIRTLYSKYRPYFAKLGVVSIAHTEGHTDAGLRAACEISKEDPRFRVYENFKENIDNMTEMLGDDYDLILHTSSRSKGTKIKEGRNYLWEVDKAVVKDLYSMLVEAEKKEQSAPLHITGINPVGVNMMLGIVLGMPKERLTGFSYVDPTRTIQWIKDFYYTKTGQFLDEKAIEARVIGQHGAEILIKSTVKINGKSLEEIGLDIDEEEAIKGIREISRDTAEAKERVRTEEKYELLHTQAADAFCKLCVEIAKQKQPSASLYTIKSLDSLLAGDGYCAFNGPVAFDYRGVSGRGISILEQPVGANLPSVTEKEMKIITEEIRAEAQFQKQAVEAFMQKSNGWFKGLFKR